MCGISGIVKKDAGREVSLEEINAMNMAAAHRGPDDQGVYLWKNVALGHTRLSIVDLSLNGHQPMNYAGRYWIVFNGEIYNYIEIKVELLKIGCRFTSNSDTEVVLAAWNQWGEAAFSRFNGMWAIVILDTSTSELIMSRDRFGVKPLYFSEGTKDFLFASEIKQILVHRSARVNEVVLLNYLLAHNENIGEETMFRDIQTMAAGEIIRYDIRHCSYKRTKFYNLEANKSIHPEDWTRRFADLLESSVNLRMRCDVQVGTCVSGGLDSAAVSAIASRLYRRNVNAKFIGIHAKGSESKVDESGYAKNVANALGLEMHIVEPSLDDFIETIDEVIRTQEEPFGSPSMFMGWHVFKKAKELGCKVMLNGQGGDEVLLGYGRYIASILTPKRPLKSLREAISMAVISGIPLRELLGYYVYFRSVYFRDIVLKHRTMVRKEWRDVYDSSPLRRSALAFRDFRRLQFSEITDVQLPHLLRYEDRNSMRHGIETRLPFLDYRLVELCVSAPIDQKIANGWTKVMLRRVAQDLLPSGVAWRGTKMGFEAPERTWITGYQNGILNEISRSEILQKYVDVKRLKTNFDCLSLKDKWGYFNVAAWERVFAVKF
jgi:asparagine synthase (glutamine-hydrolysing)